MVIFIFCTIFKQKEFMIRKQWYLIFLLSSSFYISNFRTMDEFGVENFNIDSQMSSILDLMT